MSEAQTQIVYPEEPRFSCCYCISYGVITGLKVVAVCETIYILSSALSAAVYNFGPGQHFDVQFPTTKELGIIFLVFYLFGLFASCWLFHAVKSTAPDSVIPYLVYKYISSVLFIPVLGYYVFYLRSGQLEPGLMCGWVSIYLSVYFALSILFLVIAHQGRGYLLKKGASMGQLSFNNQNYSNNEPTVIPANQAQPSPYAFYPAEEAV